MMSKYLFLVLMGLVCVGADANAAATTKKQSAIQNGTTVRARVAANGIYDQECYEAYYGCMDQFCISENENGGSCACSDKNVEYEKQLIDIQNTLAEAERISTIEVEKVRAGANADIIFNGTREYDENGNVVSVDKLSNKADKRVSLLSLWENDIDEDDVFGGASMESIADKTGTALFDAANKLCYEQLPDKCEKDLNFLRQVYSRQITSDCKAFENSIAKQKANADLTLANANADVRGALRDSLNEANKYDLGQCMVEFKKCMLTEDACGKDWINCVSTIASENMQNNAAVSTAKTKVKSVGTYDITTSTMEILSTKRTICERVLNNCVAVRDMVWPAFLKEAAPTIRLAESNAESKFRQSCLSNISNCIQKACKDDIVGRGVATMDACLSRPDMARSFCKVEIDPCERMEPLIWGYVTDKLAAMRVDACTQEVKDCFTDDTRCGADFSKCIGMDYDYIHDICPIDKLVVCKANNPEFSMNDLDSMLMGLYLNIDNAALDTCQNLVESKMLEVCGSTTDCNKFAADDTIGTGSLRSVKDGNKYRVTGMISFGSIKMGDATGKMLDGDNYLAPGEIGIQEYLAQVKSKNSGVQNYSQIVATIEEELNNVAGTINRTIEMIEQDPEIQFCVNGRDLSQINGVTNSKTTARFPNLLNQQKMLIAASALRKAQDNYNAKFNAAVADATKGASADVAQYMCQMMAVAGGAPIGAVNVDTTLTPPYAISYEVGAGLDNNVLAQGGRGSSATGTNAMIENDGWWAKKTKQELPSGTREMWSSFNRDTRTCHFCTSTVTKSCTNTYKKGFLGIGAKNETSCTESEPVESCEDIQM